MEPNADTTASTKRMLFCVHIFDIVFVRQRDEFGVCHYNCHTRNHCLGSSCQWCGSIPRAPLKVLYPHGVKMRIMCGAGFVDGCWIDDERLGFLKQIRGDLQLFATESASPNARTMMIESVSGLRVPGTCRGTRTRKSLVTRELLEVTGSSSSNCTLKKPLGTSGSCARSQQPTKSSRLDING